MNQESGTPPPDDPRIMPAEPVREPPPGENGAFTDRIFAAEGMTQPALAPTVATDNDRKHPEQKDAFREIVETVVFVVVLVLMLKAFVAEAFVIPTGSMATTLLGYNREIICPQCGFRFPLNMSRQFDPQEKEQQQRVTGCTCPNCDLRIDATNSNQFPP